MDTDKADTDANALTLNELTRRIGKLNEEREVCFW
jgi:hypothetical protein